MRNSVVLFSLVAALSSSGCAAFFYESGESHSTEGRGRSGARAVVAISDMNYGLISLEVANAGTTPIVIKRDGFLIHTTDNYYLERAKGAYEIASTYVVLPGMQHDVRIRFDLGNKHIHRGDEVELDCSEALVSGAEQLQCAPIKLIVD